MNEESPTSLNGIPAATVPTTASTYPATGSICAAGRWWKGREGDPVCASFIHPLLSRTEGVSSIFKYRLQVVTV
jgi:hypothetical protein